MVSDLSLNKLPKAAGGHIRYDEGLQLLIQELRRNPNLRVILWPYPEGPNVTARSEKESLQIEADIADYLRTGRIDPKQAKSVSIELERMFHRAQGAFEAFQIVGAASKDAGRMKEISHLLSVLAHCWKLAADPELSDESRSEWLRGESPGRFPTREHHGNSRSG